VTGTLTYPLAYRRVGMLGADLPAPATADPGLWDHGADGEPAGWPRPSGPVHTPVAGSRKVGTPQGKGAG